MPKTILITINNSGSDIGPYNLFLIDAIGNSTPGPTGVIKTQLVNGYQLTVPDSIVKIGMKSITCPNTVIEDIPVLKCRCRTYNFNGAGSSDTTFNFYKCEESQVTTLTLGNLSFPFCVDTYKPITIDGPGNYEDTDVCCVAPPTTTTSTSTSTTSTTTTETPCVDFVIQANGLERITIERVETDNPAGFKIFWGDSPTPQVIGTGISTNITHIYSTPYTGPIRICTTNLASIKTLNIKSGPLPLNTNPVTIQQSELVKLTGLLEFRIFANTRLTGVTTANLNRSLLKAVIWSSDISGDIANLPPQLQLFDVRGTSGPAPGLTGSISTMYQTRQNLTFFWVGAANNINGDINSIPTTATHFFVTGSNQVSGNFNSLTNNGALINFVCNGSNQISGNIENVNWTNLLWFEVGGSGIKTGNIDNIQFNQTMGNFSLPSTGNVNIGVTGNLSSLPNSLEFINMVSSTLVGTTLQIPRSCTTFILGENGTLTGPVTNLPTNLGQIALTGNNHAITGTINNLPANLRFVKIIGNGNNVSGYTSPRNWGSINPTTGQRTMCRFTIYGTSTVSLSPTQANDLIIDLAAADNWANSTSFVGVDDTRRIEYKGPAVSSPAAISAKTLLEGPRGVPVTTVP